MLVLPTKRSEEEKAASLKHDPAECQDLSQQLFTVVGILQTLGMESTEATRNAQRMCSTTLFRSRKPTVVELYGRGSLIDLANNRFQSLHVQGLCAMDLRTLKPNGQAWDFDKRKDRVLARKMIREQRPTWIISSPPCTVFSSWNQYNHMFMDPERKEARMQKGRLHLKFAMELCRYQLAMGRHFAHEHPASAASWNEKGASAGQR